MREKISGAAMWLCSLTLAGVLALGMFAPRSHAANPPIDAETLRLFAGQQRCAQIGPLPCVAPLPPPAGPQTVTFNENVDTTSCGTSCSFTSEAISATCPNRVVVGALSGVNTGSTSNQSVSGTIAGVTLTQAVAQTNNNGTNGYWSAVVYAAVPSGTTATFALTLSVSTIRVGLGVYTLCNLNSTTAKNTVGANNSGTTVTLNVNTAVGDVAVGSGHNDAGSTSTWSGATKDFDDNVGATGSITTGAHFAETAAQTPRAVSTTWGSCSGGNFCSGALATWH